MCAPHADISVCINTYNVELFYAGTMHAEVFVLTDCSI